MSAGDLAALAHDFFTAINKHHEVVWTWNDFRPEEKHVILAFGEAVATQARRQGVAEGLVWTREKPTVSGFYWHKNERQETGVVEIIIDGFGETVCWMNGGSDPLKHTRGEWAGPIPEPRAAKVGGEG